MPSLIRLIVVLLILGGLVVGAMVALVAIVRPTPNEVTVRIPARDLLGEEGGSNSPLPGLVRPPAEDAEGKDAEVSDSPDATAP